MKTKGDALALLIILPMMLTGIYLFMAQAGNGDVSIIDEYTKSVATFFTNQSKEINLAFK